MDQSIRDEFEVLGALSIEELYARLPPPSMGLDEAPADRVGRGQKLFAATLPKIRAHLCGKPLYRKLLLERPHRTTVEIAVLLTELIPGATIGALPCGPVLLIVVREMFDRLCPEDAP